jgi:hypothetical protein
MKIVTENNINLILLLYLGKKSINPNKMAFKETKAIPISGKEPPYSCKMDLPDKRYNKSKISNPKIT